MTATETEVPIDAYAVALNETDNYFIDEQDQRYVREIRGVYLFDRNRQTHCCEFTPSYFLIHLYDQVIPADDTPDEIVDRLDSAYGHCGGEDKYVHVWQIENIIMANKPFAVAHLGKPVYRNGEPIRSGELEYDEIMEDLREAYCGDCPL
jgi:hypothetical protein